MNKYYVSYQFKDDDGNLGVGCFEWADGGELMGEYKLELTTTGIKKFAKYIQNHYRYKSCMVLGITKLEG